MEGKGGSEFRSQNGIRKERIELKGKTREMRMRKKGPGRVECLGKGVRIKKLKE